MQEPGDGLGWTGDRSNENRLEEQQDQKPEQAAAGISTFRKESQQNEIQREQQGDREAEAPLSGRDPDGALPGEVLLDAAPASFEIPGLSLIDPTSSVRYYRGRWVQPQAQTGRFVGRRSQAYGADLWCYIEMDEGQPRRFLDLPLRGSRARGCDE